MIDIIKNALPSLFDNLPLFPEQASSMALPVDVLYGVWGALSIFFSVLVGGGAIFMMVRYRRRTRGQVGAPPTHAPIVEVFSMTVPFAIAMTMFVWGTKVYVDLRRPPENAIEYFAFGKQWMWKYQHPNGLRQINDLTIPVDTPIKVTLTSEDVIHAFFVPAFRVKQDVLPGRYTTVWFTATKTGQYHMFCAEYCGSEHSLMGGTVTVLERDQYEAWLREESAPNANPAATGEDLFTALACATCHQEQDSHRGPTLHGLFGKEVVLASGETVRADETYLRESILEPNRKLVRGYMALMPTFTGQVTEEQVGHLVRYLKTLGTASADGAGEHPTSAMSGGAGGG
ncbi:MAG TPA: cytochrome c oxidase subunit II [Thermoanaerobaculia bacterium]|nr:cytochrome c oxidase subunit II [Thermoanaerobaculia bacterium]